MELPISRLKEIPMDIPIRIPIGVTWEFPGALSFPWESPWELLVPWYTVAPASVVSLLSPLGFLS